MTLYAVVDDVTGEILREGYAPQNDVANQAIAAGETSVERDASVSGPTHRYDWGAEGFIERPVSPAVIDKTEITADGLDEATLSNVPEGAEISVRTATGRENLVMDASSTLVLTSAVPDTLTVTIRNWPDQDATFEVRAV